jgi:ubiquinone/menaquinone biosynthesis C-methylase UbiE
MAYGSRNMPDPDACVANLIALLAPGGVICFHEYSVADSRWSRSVWNLVMLLIVTPLAFLTTGSTDIFGYLRRSVLEFDGKGAFEERLRRTGFMEVETLPMDGWQRNVTHTFRARRLR